MFRLLQIKIRKKYSLKQYLKIVVIFCFVFLMKAQSFAAVDVNSFLIDQYEKYKDENPFFGSSGKLFATNLYDLSMKVVKKNDFVPSYETITFITKQFNTDYACNLMDMDVTNILLYFDKEFATALKWMADADMAMEDFYISEKSFLASCSKLASCYKSFVGSTDQKSPQSLCKTMIYDYRQSAKDSFYMSSVLDQDSFGGDVFQNGTTDDSDYDLLVDIDMIGKLLFEGFKPAEEVLFYQLPSVSLQNFWDEAQLGIANGTLPPSVSVGYYFENGQWKPGMLCPQAVEEYTQAGLFSPGTEEPQGDGRDPGFGDEEIDDFISNFQDPVGQPANINGLGVMGDVCFDSIVCGDGILNDNSEEECDDGNNINGDGCNSFCQLEECGDGFVNNNDTEECDDANDSNEDECLTSCELNVCGDGFLFEGVEECDDGNLNNGDGCNRLCQIRIVDSAGYCGDGIRQTGEDCDDGNNIDNDACTDRCEFAVCGDGLVWPDHEGCDDGNKINGDGCNMLCEIEEGEYCGNGIRESGEYCDLGSENSYNASCLPNCHLNRCGDGNLNLGVEECDDGNRSDYDCCSSECESVDIIDSDFFNLGNLLEDIDALGEGVGPEISEGCMQDCRDLPTADKIVCMTECACGEVESAALPKNGNAVVEAGSFKIRYCMIAAQPENITRGKRVYSIEEIFMELKTILQTLRDSGELMKSVETREFLDSSMKENNIADMLGLNLIVTKKPLFDGNTEEVELQKQTAYYENFEDSVAGLDGDLPGTDYQRNKYVVIANVAALKAQNEIYSDREELDGTIEQISELMENDFVDMGEDIVFTLQMQKNALVNEEVMEFLEKNLKFRQSVNEMFMDILDAAILLKGKIES